eukprot:CFRG2605T1
MARVWGKKAHEYFWSRVGHIASDNLRKENELHPNYDGDYNIDCDQILQFFEVDAAQIHFANFLSYDEAIELEEKRIEYYNHVNAVDFHNELLAQLLLHDLPDMKQRLLNAYKTGDTEAEKLARISLAQCKLDVSERKSSRNRRERQRLECTTALSRLINDVKTAHYFQHKSWNLNGLNSSETHRNMQVPITDGGGKGDHESSAHDSIAVTSSVLTGAMAGLRKRRARYIPDHEIARLLENTSE